MLHHLLQLEDLLSETLRHHDFQRRGRLGSEHRGNGDAGRDGSRRIVKEGVSEDTGPGGIRRGSAWSVGLQSCEG